MKKLPALILFIFPLAAITGQPIPVNFEGHADVGFMENKGYFKYDQKEQVYYLAGGGENIWGMADAFTFAWKKMQGDYILTTNVEILGSEGDPHRKAGWMVRENLDPDAPYVDAIVHADGLTSLQFRRTKGGETREITNRDINNPSTIRLEKQGNIYIMHAAQAGQPMKKVGEIILELPEIVYLGLVINAHQKGGYEQAKFSNTRISVPVEAIENLSPAISKNTVKSRLETINIHTGLRKIIYQDNNHFEAPNWSRDGSYFIYNSNGLLYKLKNQPDAISEVVKTDFAIRCNNDHGISFDGQQLAISHTSEQTGNSIIYTLPVDGGIPKQITPQGPSYWHGWSPDDKTLTYCAERGGEYDVYTIPAQGGKEKRLTNAAGLDDGPEYTYDGRYIYFNSVRTGKMQIWRMKPDGNEQQQITFDEYNNWFPHPSPNGQWIAFITYEDEVAPGSHPANKRVMLRIIPLEGGTPKTIAYLYGGQGTINVPSWSPDSNELSFVSYTFE